MNTDNLKHRLNQIKNNFPFFKEKPEVRSDAPEPVKVTEGNREKLAFECVNIVDAHNPSNFEIFLRDEKEIDLLIKLLQELKKKPGGFSMTKTVGQVNKTWIHASPEDWENTIKPNLLKRLNDFKMRIINIDTTNGEIESE